MTGGTRLPKPCFHPAAQTGALEPHPLAGTGQNSLNPSLGKRGLCRGHWLGQPALSRNRVETGEPMALPGPLPLVWEPDLVTVCRASCLKLTYRGCQIHTIRYIGQDIHSGTSWRGLRAVCLALNFSVCSCHRRCWAGLLGCRPLPFPGPGASLRPPPPVLSHPVLGAQAVTPGCGSRMGPLSQATLRGPIAEGLAEQTRHCQAPLRVWEHLPP